MSYDRADDPPTRRHERRRRPDAPSTVVSFLRPEGKFDAHVIESFCHYVHFFASPEAAETWTAEHPGTFTLSLTEAFEIAQLTNRAKFAAALSQ